MGPDVARTRALHGARPRHHRCVTEGSHVLRPARSRLHPAEAQSCSDRFRPAAQSRLHGKLLEARVLGKPGGGDIETWRPPQGSGGESELPSLSGPARLIHAPEPLVPGCRRPPRPPLAGSPGTDEAARMGRPQPRSAGPESACPGSGRASRRTKLASASDGPSSGPGLRRPPWAFARPLCTLFSQTCNAVRTA